MDVDAVEERAADAVDVFFDLQAGGFAPIVEPLYRWALIGTSSFEIAFYFDRLSAIMTLVVTGVGSVIHIYSTGYMHNDKSFGRFFAYLNLFLFFMLLLVLGKSLLVLFVGWEGVGLCSYLLIGFWYHKPSANAAAIKAFVVLRLGQTPSEELKEALVQHVRRELGPIATPSEVVFLDKLPKTRSGKILRRLLKAQALGKDPGDLSTLEE